MSSKLFLEGHQCDAPPECRCSCHRPTVDCSADPGRTKQSFAKEADINFIMERYQRTGYLVDPGVVAVREAMYGNFADGMDYLDLQNRLVGMRSLFEGFPSSIRERFGNDPSRLLDFVVDPENEAEAVALGLLNPAKAGPGQDGLLPVAPQAGAGGPVSSPGEAVGSPAPSSAPVEAPKGPQA